MRFVTLTLAAIGTLSAPAIAHPEHDAPRIQRKPIGEAAQDAVIKLVTQAKLPASWGSVKPLKSEMKMKQGAQQWVVTFRNDAIRVPAKRMLYVVLTPSGEFISAGPRPS